MSRNLSTTEVARILGWSEAQVRAVVRSGLCHPTRRGRRYGFSFQDLVVLYAARRLREQHVPASRVRRALAALVAQLPSGRSLSGLRIYADGADVAVREGRTAWNPETGQTLLDFGVDDVERLVHDLEEVRARVRGESPPLGEAHVAFQRGLALEDDDPVAASAAYARAVELDPGLVDACVNLGRLSHDRGDVDAAVRLYRQALEYSPDDPIVHFNLAIALEDTKHVDDAIRHYCRALDLDGDFADAHYNVATLYERLGHGVDALRHYHAYKRLTEG